MPEVVKQPWRGNLTTVFLYRRRPQLHPLASSVITLFFIVLT